MIAQQSANSEAIAKPAVSLVNCRHGFGDALRFDAVVDGAYPDRSASLWLSQAGEKWSDCYIAIPHATIECACAVVAVISRYYVGSVCRANAPIIIRLCWPGAPAEEWKLSI